MPVCPYFEKYLLKSLDIWLTCRIIGDVENDIRKLSVISNPRKKMYFHVKWNQQ